MGISSNLLALLVCALLACTKSAAVELQVFAAASLTDVLREIANCYEKLHPAKMIFNFAGSSTLARQIQEGASADLFISADPEKVAQLEAKRLIVPGTPKPLLSNRLVVVVPEDNPHAISSPADLLRVRRIALAEPSTVPAGIYARRYLRAENLWAQVEHRVVPTENVRAALAAVDSGNVDAAIVYATDAAMAKRAKIAWKAPKNVPDIVYVAALPKDGKHRAEATAFLEFLQETEAREIFRRHGFLPLPKE